MDLPVNINKVEIAALIGDIIQSYSQSRIAVEI